MRRKRNMRGAVRIDPTNLRDIVKDDRTSTGLGVVFKPKGFNSHFEIVTDEIGNTEVMVHVELQPNREPLFCRLGAGAGGVSGGGVWAIPHIGMEVGVLLPFGELEGDPFIICTISHTVAAGLTESTIVIAAPPGGTVLIHDGSTGDEEPLIRRSEFNSHIHKDTKPGSPIEFSGGVASDADGTSVLRAK